jgi:DNA-binding MarR family transcriptional regulator|tara:strand:- start:638 stop:928 length:291 start_codon:yes stop_codon:yes gene_type:complete
MVNSKFDPIIHAPNRLQICALLSPLDQVEFRVIREELDVSDSVLSKHIKQLEDVGYINQKKSKVNGRARRWFHLTDKGRSAFELHVEELKRIVSDL